MRVGWKGEKKRRIGIAVRREETKREEEEEGREWSVVESELRLVMDRGWTGPGAKLLGARYLLSSKCLFPRSFQKADGAANAARALLLDTPRSMQPWTIRSAQANATVKLARPPGEGAVAGRQTKDTPSLIQRHQNTSRQSKGREKKGRGGCCLR